MLVLTRKPEQKIHIGNNITITVLEVKNNKVVRLGIDAPREVRVFRGEIVARMAKEAAWQASPLETRDLDVAAPQANGAAQDDRLNPQADAAPPEISRRRVPGVLTPAPLMRPPQRLGPTSLRALAAAHRR